MHDSHTLDLGSDLTTIAEQHHLLMRLAELSDVRGPSAWSDDHELHLLMQRYEASTVRLSA